MTMSASQAAETSSNGRVPHPVSGGPVVQLPGAFGNFVTQAWTDLVTGAEHLAVSSPNPPGTARRRWSGSTPSALPATSSDPTAATAASSWPTPWK